VSSYREWITALRDLGLGRHSRVLVHASLDTLAPVAGGGDTVVGALAATCEMVVMPAFTERTLVTPPVGPADNGLAYGEAQNVEAEFFRPELPVDPALGEVAEALRRHPKATRSVHPALSFAGIQADEALQAQSVSEPLGPIRWLAEFDADVVLIGVDHRKNVTLHWAERLAGRKQFLRWALTSDGIVECPAYPGCPDGFQAIAPRLRGITREAVLGDDPLQAIPLRDLIHVAVAWLREDPRALLCDRAGCLRCAAVRASVRVGSE
jgi:aminoglycoside 3-N-acetyltransferase